MGTVTAHLMGPMFRCDDGKTGNALGFASSSERIDVAEKCHAHSRKASQQAGISVCETMCTANTATPQIRSQSLPRTRTKTSGASRLAAIMNTILRSRRPPDVLIPRDEVLHGAGTIGGDDLEAMLEVGFDDRSDGHGSRLHMQQQNPSSTHLLPPQNVPRFQLSDGGPSPSASPQPYSHQQDYIAVARSEAGVTAQPPPRTILSPTTPMTPGMGQAMSTAVGGECQTHARKRSGGGGRGGPPDYGPLGPLDPGSRF